MDDVWLVKYLQLRIRFVLTKEKKNIPHRGITLIYFLHFRETYI